MSKILDLKRQIQCTLADIDKLQGRLEKEERRTNPRKHLIGALRNDIQDAQKQLNGFRNRLYPLIGMKGEKNVESNSSQQS